VNYNSELPKPRKLLILGNVNYRFSAWAIALTISAQQALLSADSDWPQWQGGNRDGKSLERGFLKTWPAEGLKLIWKAGNLGEGYAGVSVVGNRLYAMGGLSDANAIMAIDTKDGKILWSTKFGVAGLVGNASSGNVFPGPRGTPTVDGDRLYGVDHRGQFICVTSNDGKIQWKRHFVDDFGGTVPRWGFAESPLVDGNQVVATPGGPKGAIVALNKQTGDVIWQSREFTDEAQYSSIVAAEIGGVHHYVQLTSESVVGISPKDGSVLWKAARPGRVAVIPTPVVDGDYVYVTSGYDVGCNLFKVALKDGKFTVEQVYSNRNMVNQHGGVVKVGEHLYGYSDSKGLVCQNFLTGDIVWGERERVKKGAVSYADGMLYFREERSGDMVLIEADPKGYSEKGRFKQPDRAKEMAWPHPVFAAGRFYLRDQNALLCYDLLGK
jgi:outer membrane protein assembly factor BamB